MQITSSLFRLFLIHLFYLFKNLISSALYLTECHDSDNASDEDAESDAVVDAAQVFLRIGLVDIVDEPAEEYDEERNPDLEPIDVEFFHVQCVLPYFEQIPLYELVRMDMRVNVVIPC